MILRMHPRVVRNAGRVTPLLLLRDRCVQPLANDPIAKRRGVSQPPFLRFLPTTVYIHLIVLQSSNGQPLPQPQGVNPKRHNATLLDGRKRQAIVTALANGESKRGIARRLSVSANTVTAIAEQEWSQVEARKQLLAAQAERNAYIAGEQISEALQKGNIPIASLVPVYGVSLDKALALRGDSLSTVRHIHSVDLSDSDLVAFALQRSKQLDAEKRAKAAVVEVPALPA
jgi:hypothetical protein